NRCRAKDVAEASRPERLEQELPSERANHEVQERRGQRQSEPLGPRVPNLGEDAPEIRLPEEQCEEARGKREHDNRANVGAHRALSASYYTAQHVVVVSERRQPVRSALPPEDRVPLASPILQTTLLDRPPDRQGKVRDIYDFGDTLLIVASDR